MEKTPASNFSNFFNFFGQNLMYEKKFPFANQFWLNKFEALSLFKMHFNLYLFDHFQ